MTSTNENTEEILDDLTKELWDDLDEDNSFPNKRPLLAHYTSIENIENIIRGQELWLSNPLLMNDLEELKFGILEGARLFRESESLIKACNNSQAHELLINKFDEHITMLDTKGALDIYILCFSYHEDSDNDGRLSMWRGYGNNGGGAALIFDTAKLDPVDDSPLILSPVIYASKADRIDWIKNKIEKIAQIISSEKLPSNKIPNLARAFFLRLMMFSLHAKHKGFEEEKEWRLVYISTLDPEKYGNPMYSYHNSSKGIEPKFKLKLTSNHALTQKDFNFDSVIHQIIVGPTASSMLSIRALERMLESYGLNSLSQRILASTIPYRPQ